MMFHRLRAILPAILSVAAMVLLLTLVKSASAEEALLVRVPLF